MRRGEARQGKGLATSNRRSGQRFLFMGTIPQIYELVSVENFWMHLFREQNQFKCIENCDVSRRLLSGMKKDL